MVAVLLVWILVTVSVLLALQVRSWAESRTKGPKPESVDRMLVRLDKAERMALLIRDEEEREAYLAGISMQRRKLLLAQAMGASLGSFGSSDQIDPGNPLWRP